MAFIGVLLVSIILLIILGAACLGPVCIVASLILWVIHLVRKRTAKPEIKWIRIASVVLAITGGCMLLPLCILIFLFPA